jgi:hypothetical protein
MSIRRNFNELFDEISDDFTLMSHRKTSEESFFEVTNFVTTQKMSNSEVHRKIAVFRQMFIRWTSDGNSSSKELGESVHDIM